MSPGSYPGSYPQRAPSLSARTVLTLINEDPWRNGEGEILANKPQKSHAIAFLMAGLFPRETIRRAVSSRPFPSGRARQSR
jgi:hypothetical protein